MANWTKITKPSLSGTEFAFGTQAFGTTYFGGQAATGNWTKITKVADSWTKITKAT